MVQTDNCSQKLCDSCCQFGSQKGCQQASQHVSVPRYASQRWADLVLRIGIASIRDVRRVPSSRLIEFVYQERELREHGFHWHARILRAWAHRYWWNLRPEGPTPSKDGGLSS